MTLDSALELPSLSTIDPPTNANDQIITNPRYKTKGMTMKQAYSLYRAQFPGPASFPNNGAGCGTKNNGVFAFSCSTFLDRILRYPFLPHH